MRPLRDAESMLRRFFELSRVIGMRVGGKTRVPTLFEEFMSLLQSNGLPEASANLGRGGVRIEAEVVEEIVARLEDAT
jgi:hypothetical protein